MGLIPFCLEGIRLIIKHAYIERFRALRGLDFDLGSKITAIVGHNGTMKTTILGILSQTFTLSKNHPMVGEKTIDGYNFHSQFGEKFKLTDKDVAGEHRWRLSLYDGVYKTDYFEAESIVRDKKSNQIRFWSTEGRGADMNYPQVPVYYISLKRVTPIGEEKKVNVASELEEEEKLLLFQEYKAIFSVASDSKLCVETITSTNKHSAAIHTDRYDAVTISAGQDNVAKILLAVLSFRRLKNKYPSDYIGGIILIDEIESTLHPSAQKVLIKRIYKYSKEYNIQFIFTTHSPSVIKAAFPDKYNKGEAQLLYLKRVGESVNSFTNPNIDDVVAELSGEVIKKKRKNKKLCVFCEDIVARKILRNLLSSYKDYIKFSTCSLGAEEYLELIRAGLLSIKEAVVFLDGDKNTAPVNNKIKKSNAKNVLFLPSTSCPEKMIYTFLYNLEDDDCFWDNSLGGFDKEKCFLEYATLLDKKTPTEIYKKWFESVSSNFGKGYNKLFNYWKVRENEEFDSFIRSFIIAYNYVAQNYQYDEISLPDKE